MIADLSAAANIANAASVTVLADSIAPSLTSATIKYTDTQASLTTGGATSVLYKAKAATAPGINGTGVYVRYTNVGATATELVTLLSNTPAVGLTTIEVRTRTGGSTSAQIAAAVNANVFSSAIVDSDRRRGRHGQVDAASSASESPHQWYDQPGRHGDLLGGRVPWLASRCGLAPPGQHRCQHRQ